MVAPLSSIVIDSNDENNLRIPLERWKRLNVVRVDDDESISWAWDTIIWIAGFIGFLIFLWGGAAVDDAWPGYLPDISEPVAGLIAVASVVGLVSLILLTNAVGRFHLMAFASETTTLFLTGMIGIGLPIMTAFYYGGGREAIDEPRSLAEFGRVLQIVVVVVASILPALLYFLFDRQRLDTLRKQFYRDVFRLDPSLRTISDVHSKYGNQIEEVYGPEQAGIGGRRVAGSRWAIAIATLVITWGWIVALMPVGPLPAVNDSLDLLALLQPPTEPVVFGFLGAYVFALNLVVRRYVRGDLRPKAYGSITVRILLVVVLSWLFQLMWLPNDEMLLAFTFFAGFVPDTALVRFQELIRFKLYGAEMHPLTKLQGIDLYDRARLMDEGVTNIESLAHHDLIDLLLQTRIPAPRLIDWVDQAILYLHLGIDERQEQDRIPSPLLHLRKHGVRTATDLQDVMSKVRLLNGSTTDDLSTLMTHDGQSNHLDFVLMTLEDEEWLRYIHYWRSSMFDDDQVISNPALIYSNARAVMSRRVRRGTRFSRRLPSAGGSVTFDGATLPVGSAGE